jgi:hypothetical protein
MNLGELLNPAANDAYLDFSYWAFFSEIVAIAVLSRTCDQYGQESYICDSLLFCACSCRDGDHRRNASKVLPNFGFLVERLGSCHFAENLYFYASSLLDGRH